MKFELNEWKKQLTDEEILADIQEMPKHLAKTIYQFLHIDRMVNTLKRQSKLISVLGKMLYCKQAFEMKERQPN